MDSQEGSGILLMLESIDKRLRDLDEKIVGKEKFNQFREDTDTKLSDLYNKYNDVHEKCTVVITAQNAVATKEEIARSEEKTLEKAKKYDEEIHETLDSIKTDIKELNKKMGFLDFSWCSLNWLWRNKKGATLIFTFATLWLYIIDTIARGIQWTYFPPRLGP